MGQAYDDLKNSLLKYFGTVDVDGVTTDKLKFATKITDKLIEDYKKEVVGTETKRIKKEVQKEVDGENREKRVSSVMKIVAEGLSVGFLVGLLTNQSTELITLLKGGANAVTPTLMIIVILLLLIVIVTLAVLANDIKSLL